MKMFSCFYFYCVVFQDFINFIPDFPHLEFSHECKVGSAEDCVLDMIKEHNKWLNTLNKWT